MTELCDFNLANYIDWAYVNSPPQYGKFEEASFWQLNAPADEPVDAHINKQVNEQIEIDVIIGLAREKQEKTFKTHEKPLRLIVLQNTVVKHILQKITVQYQN